jgi:hypothetical protein
MNLGACNRCANPDLNIEDFEGGYRARLRKRVGHCGMAAHMAWRRPLSRNWIAL